MGGRVSSEKASDWNLNVQLWEINYGIMDDQIRE